MPARYLSLSHSSGCMLQNAHMEDLARTESATGDNDAMRVTGCLVVVTGGDL
jgi:hypothetical protein